MKNKVTQHTLSFKGSFGKRLIKSDFFLAKNNSMVPARLVIFFHGCCGTVYDHQPTTYQLLAQKLSTVNDINCAIFETSRMVSKLDFKEGMIDFQTFNQQAFVGKTFENELTDASRAVRELIQVATEKIGSSFSLTFVGFSLGGLIATIIAKQYPVDRLFLFGSAALFDVDHDLPILGNGFLSKEGRRILIDAASHFTSQVMIVRGTSDDTAPRKEAIKLFEYFTEADERNFSEWSGVDHRFRQKNYVDDLSLLPRMQSLILGLR